jgi:hypothetical protein
MRAAALIIAIAVISGCVGQTAGDSTQEFVDSFSWNAGEGKCSDTNQTQLGISLDPTNPLHYVLEGNLYASTPCFAVSTFDSFKKGKVMIDITTFEIGDKAACIQCIGAIPFRADIVLKRPIGGELTGILVQQNGQPILEVTAPR